ncbi:Bug family tripartite tricarboxylate transporter substrate binding protein [Polaromonas sp.]|uniref:Bug family tripartite tricarboxylate transporter substrate binding protein n=1 Tax=Polaromonas sp. TaxID=1869339 RepID=UPI003BABC36F
MQRRNFNKSIATALSIPFIHGLGLAQPMAYPEKPIKIINMFPAGGLADSISRAVAQRLSQTWGQPVVVENRPGANGIIAADAVAKSPADGYTLFWANDAAISINPAMYEKLPYNPQSDFSPISVVAETVECLIVSGDLPVGNVRELVQYAKTNPGKLNYGSFGKGSLAHLSGEAFNNATGANLVHIPFKGVAEVIPAMLSGQIQVLFTAQGAPLQFIKTGKLKALAVFSQSRQATLPNVATAREQGLAMEARAWFGLMAPAKTAPEIISKIAGEVANISRSKEFREKVLDDVGLAAVGSSPAEFASMLRGDRDKYAKQVKAANVKLE